MAANFREYLKAHWLGITVGIIGIVLFVIYLIDEYLSYGVGLLEHLGQLIIPHILIFLTLPLFAAVGWLLDRKVMLEREARKSEEKFRELFENAYDLIFTIDLNGNFTSANNAVVEVTGYTPDEIIKLNIAHFLPADVLQATKRGIARIAKGETLEPYEYEFTKKDGSKGIVELSYRAILVEGKAVGIHCIARDITEKKLAEQALRESERRYRELFENAYDVIFTLDLNGFLTSVNEAGLRLSGYTREEATGMNISKFLAPGELQRAGDRIRRVAGGEIVSPVEYEFIRKDGSRGILELSSRPILESGKVTGLHCIGRDITEKKLLQQKIAESERYLKDIIESSGDAIIALDAKGNVVLFNSGAEHIFGYCREEMIGRNIVEDGRAEFYGDVETAKRIMGAMRESEDGRITNFEVPGKTKDGRDLYLSVSGSLLKNEKGEEIGSLGVIKNITERKRMEQALRESEERYRRLVELSPDAIAVHSGGKIVFINTAGARLLGAANPEQLIGKPIMDFLHSDYRDIVKGRIQRISEERKEVTLTEEKFIRLDGTVIDVEVAAIPLTYQGKPAVQAVVRDITERKELEREILEAKEDAELYLDIMSHDINNLNQIGLGYLELLLDSEELDEVQRKYATKSLNSVRGSIRLIGDVRLLQQIRGPSEFRDIDLNEVISEVVNEFSTNPYKKVDFKYNSRSGLVVKADPLIKEVFVNFIGNSIKYSGESVEIGICVGEAVRDGREFYRVCVEDNGDGVLDEKKGVIFRRFERGSRKASGKGLGLYIVKMLVEKYGGEVWVEDRVKGDYTMGARFCFTIPKPA